MAVLAMREDHGHRGDDRGRVGDRVVGEQQPADRAVVQAGAQLFDVETATFMPNMPPTPFKLSSRGRSRSAGSNFADRISTKSQPVVGLAQQPAALIWMPLPQSASEASRTPA